jgi:hypothetical protein
MNGPSSPLGAGTNLEKLYLPERGDSGNFPEKSQGGKSNLPKKQPTLSALAEGGQEAQAAKEENPNCHHPTKGRAPNRPVLFAIGLFGLQ